MLANTLTSVTTILILTAIAYLNFSPCNALRMINLDAPDSAFQGDTIQLSCFFSLAQDSSNNEENTTASSRTWIQKSNSQGGKFKSDSPLPTNRLEIVDKEAAGELLYAIKWYKDEQEFFRYLEKDRPKKQWLPTDGVIVDIAKSDKHTVVLKSISLKTSGLYRCEVSTDAPNFVTKNIQRKMQIYSLPNGGPQIELNKSRAKSENVKYSLGDRIELTCTAPNSKPPASLDWIINDTLNLSATSNNISKQLFQVKNQRFVHLPTIGSSSIKPPIKPSKAATYATYELYNETLALNAAGVLISLTGSLNQLVEMSTSRLNFTVDTNLLQLLSNSTQSLADQGLMSRKEIASLRTETTNGQKQQYHSFDFKDSKRLISTRQLFLDKNPISTTKSSVDSENRSKFWRIKREISAIETSAPIYNLGGKRRVSKGGRVTTYDNHRPLLKIKCVARVLQLVMSDEVKIQITHILRDSKNIMETASAQKQHKPNVKNSGGTRYRVDDHLCFMILLIMCQMFHVYTSCLNKVHTTELIGFANLDPTLTGTFERSRNRSIV